MPDLVESSLSKARKFYGIIVPRDVWWTRIVVNTLAFFTWLFKLNFRPYVHSIQQMEEIINHQGFSKIHQGFRMQWVILLFEKSELAAK